MDRGEALGAVARLHALRRGTMRITIQSAVRLRGRSMVLALGAVAAVAGCLIPYVSAAAPDVTITPSSLIFAGRPLGTSADAQAVQVTNTSDQPLAISTLRLTGTNPDDFAQGTECPIAPDTLSVGASCTIDVSFTPHGEGTRTATLAIGDDANSSPQTVELSGVGIAAPKVHFDRAALDFGSVQVGDHSAPQTVTLTNTGSATLEISSIGFAGTAAAAFSETTTCDPTGRVAAGTSCTVDIVFAPSSSGGKTAALVLTDNAADTPQSVALTAVASAAPVPSVGLTPTTLSFASQAVGTPSAPQVVTVTNTGGAPLTMNSLNLTGVQAGDFADTSDCPIAPATIAAGASCAVTVTFSPSATGTRTATLTIADNASGSPQGVALTGAGVVAGTYLSDDFESGALSGWDPLSSSDSTIALDSTVAHNGTASVRFTNNSSDQYSRLSADLAGGGHAQTYTRFCFRIAPGLSQGIEIVNGRAITAEYPLGIRRFVITYNPVTQGLEAYFFNEQLQRLDMYAATGQVQTGRWHCAELYLDESSNGHAQLWLDGASVGTVDGDLSTPSAYDRLYLWNQAAAGTVWFDDIKVADSRIGTTSGGGASSTLTLTPSTLDFGAQNTGTTSTGHTATLTNAGTTPLTINNITVTGTNPTDFTQTNNCPAQLAGGSSCAATVTFSPSATGTRTATLTIDDNASGSPQGVALTGAGVVAGTYLSDDFESGSVSAWDAQTSSAATVAVDSTAANSGSASVRFTNNSNDQFGRLSADLAGGGHAQTYTRFCFDVAPGLTAGITIASGRAITTAEPLGV